MKTLFLPLLFFIVAVGCKKSHKCEDGPFSRGYIIGFDPCTARSNSNIKGYVIKFENNPDTVVGYFSLPNYISIPDSLFNDYANNYLFTNGFRDKFIIKANYRDAKASEVVTVLCYPYIYSGSFFRATQGKQIIIECTTQ